MEELKNDLYSYLKIDIYAEEVALFNTKNKVIEDIYFTDESLVIEFDNNIISFLNGATSIRDISIVKGKKILSKAHICYEDDFIIYKYMIEGIDEYFQVRCLKAKLKNSIKDRDVLLFYTYSMFFKMVKDIVVNKNEVILVVELIDGNVKEYKFNGVKLNGKSNYIKGYFKSELDDFEMVCGDKYKFSCNLYKDDRYVPFGIEFDSVVVLK